MWCARPVGRLPNSQVTVMARTRRLGRSNSGPSKWISLPAATVLFAGVALGSLPAIVRVDQVGYLPADAKHAYLMANHRVRHATWDVVDGASHVVAHGTVGTTNRGPWNTNYPDVYDITFSGLGALGTYHLVAGYDRRSDHRRRVATRPALTVALLGEPAIPSIMVDAYLSLTEEKPP
jgi:Cellulase N-terminal ig-like domain